MSREFEPGDFAPQYGNDLFEPDDGRDSQAYEGSSDMPESMRNIDPLAQRSYLLDDDLETVADLDNELGTEAPEEDEPAVELPEQENELAFEE